MADEVNKLVPLDLSRVFSSFPTLETERLRLRKITLDDAEAIFDYASDPIATEFMIFRRHESIQQSIEFIENSAKLFEKQEIIGFAIALKESNELIGTCSFHRIAPDHHRAEIGYILRRKFWGSGYMTEVVRELIHFGFDQMHMHRLYAHCDIHNHASARVMERCGMVLEGTFRDNEILHGQFVSTKVYATIRADKVTSSSLYPSNSTERVLQTAA